MRIFVAFKATVIAKESQWRTGSEPLPPGWDSSMTIRAIVPYWTRRWITPVFLRRFGCEFR